MSATEDTSREFDWGFDELNDTLPQPRTLSKTPTMFKTLFSSGLFWNKTLTLCVTSLFSFCEIFISLHAMILISWQLFVGVLDWFGLQGETDAHFRLISVLLYVTFASNILLIPLPLIEGCMPRSQYVSVCEKADLFCTYCHYLVGVGVVLGTEWLWDSQSQFYPCLYIVFVMVILFKFLLIPLQELSQLRYLSTHEVANQFYALCVYFTELVMLLEIGSLWYTRSQFENYSLVLWVAILLLKSLQDTWQRKYPNGIFLEQRQLEYFGEYATALFESFIFSNPDLLKSINELDPLNRKKPESTR